MLVLTPMTSLLIYNVDRSYNPGLEFNPSKSTIISSIEALILLSIIPFTYHDSETFPCNDAYSTNVEIDGRHYGVILTIPKATWPVGLLFNSACKY